MFGFEFSGEMEAAIVAYYGKKQEVEPGEDDNMNDNQDNTDDENEPDEMTEDMKAFERKAINALKKGKSPAVKFDSNFIEETFVSAIQGQLETATTQDQIKSIFEFASVEYP
jgi:hypothetical protein